MEQRFKFSYNKYLLEFKKPAGTSRGTLSTKTSYFIEVNDLLTGKKGIGECSILPKLSLDDIPNIEDVIEQTCHELNETQWLGIPEQLKSYPALYFALEMALRDLSAEGKFTLYKNPFSRGEKGIPINGLIWMGSIDEMWEQLTSKVEQGFRCIKIKVGALDFEAECELLQRFRDEYGYDIALRLDVNGAFSPEDAMEKLEILSSFNIHSIEQPIKQGQRPEMSQVCSSSPIPIALDEELIGISDITEKKRLLEEVRPQFIILKPSLLGGFAATDEWISLAEEMNIGWWATSALESNIGLIAIAQWVGSKKTALPQGLGTGGLFTNNIELPLTVIDDELWIKKSTNNLKQTSI